MAHRFFPSILIYSRVRCKEFNTNNFQLNFTIIVVSLNVETMKVIDYSIYLFIVHIFFRVSLLNSPSCILVMTLNLDTSNCAFDYSF